MNLTDIFTSQAIAAYYSEVASNKKAYLGSSLFPAKKKAGLDLKWLKGYKGLPVSLTPSTFDSKSTFRDRIGVEQVQTEMPFFRESMLIKEADQQEIMRVQDSKDPYAKQVLDSIFNDTQTLIEGANVVPERMIMQLLAPIGGNVGITINANGVDYSYNYDPDGAWKSEHYCKITNNMWNDATNCDPISDLETALNAQENVSGTRPTVALMSQKTFKYIKNSLKLRNVILSQNTTPNIYVTDINVKQILKEMLNLDVVVYSKKFKDNAGTEMNFFPDDIVTLVPNGNLGNTWYGTTPEERSKGNNLDVSIVNTGVAVTVTQTSDPVNTKTTVSEIVLPSFERMNDCYAIQVVTE